MSQHTTQNPRRFEMRQEAPRPSIVTAADLRGLAAELCPCASPQCGNLHDKSRRALQAAAKRIEGLEDKLARRDEKLRRLRATIAEIPELLNDLERTSQEDL